VGALERNALDFERTDLGTHSLVPASREPLRSR
jgi:hypothetical protein